MNLKENNILTSEEWEKREGMIDMFSDLHKDARGFRPRRDYSVLSLDELQSYFDMFKEECRYNEVIKQEKESNGVKSFEKLVGNVKKMCSCGRSKAIEFLMDAEEVGGDWGFFCYLNDLPHGYGR